jgi:hypothetical protein
VSIEPGGYSDDDLNNVTASPDDASYECGWHDGTDYGHRLAERELICPQCGARYTDAPPT